MSKIPSREKRYLAYILVFAGAIFNTSVPLIEALTGRSLATPSLFQPLEVSREDLLQAFEELPADLVTVVIACSLILFITEVYFRDKERE